jgi:hypothetical protein
MNAFFLRNFYTENGLFLMFFFSSGIFLMINEFSLGSSVSLFFVILSRFDFLEKKEKWDYLWNL